MREPRSRARAPDIVTQQLARTTRGIPFGAPDGGLTDLFFLVACRDPRTHLKVLARIARLMLRPSFVDELRAAENSADLLQVIESAETDLGEI